MMNQVTYTLFIDDNGVPREGLTPTIVNLIDIHTGVDSSATAPVITPLSGGFYKFTFDWTGEASNSAYVLRIDAGNEIANPVQRYIRMRIEQLDNVYNAATRIENATSSLETKIDGLQPLIQRLLDIEQGTWKILNNQLVVYSPEGEELLKHDLIDRHGFATSTSPFQRRAIFVKDIV